MPHLSICIPTYCQIAYLKETLHSVQQQDYDDYEIIISDDSPDDSVARLVQSMDFGSRLKYRHNPTPLGSPANWNAAIRQAEGDYIKVLHHDDQLAHPGALRAFVDLLDNAPEVDFAFGASVVESVNTGVKRVHAPTANQLKWLGSTPEKLFLGNVIGAPSATIYRNGLNIEYDERMKWLVDIDFYIRMLQNNAQFAYTKQPLIVTPTNAGHQVTEICKNDASIELAEYLLLYGKNRAVLERDPATVLEWFRLFKKYHIHSQEELESLQIEPDATDSVLVQILGKYENSWLFYIPLKFYARLFELFRRMKGYA